MTKAKPSRGDRRRRKLDEATELALQVEEQVEQLVIDQRRYAFRPEPRCRICQHEEVSSKVNRMLALGRTYASILREIDPLVEDLPEVQRPTYNSVYNHAKRHFPIDHSAQALYREILERRAVESDQNFIEGVGHAVTTLGYLETMMVKAYRGLVSGETEVNVEQGMKAAVKLHEIASVNEGQMEAAQAAAQVTHIIEAVRAVVPEQYWSEIVGYLDGKVDGVGEGEPIDAEVVTETHSAEDPAYQPQVEALDDEDPDLDD